MGLDDRVRVTREQVLAAYAVLRREGEWLRDRLEALQDDLRLRPCGGDPVSRDTAEVYSWKFVEAPDSIYRQYLKYSQTLLDAAVELRVAAETYGFTESDITESLARYRP
ncbi:MULTISPECIES: hypothetical protein [unclassified Crossiella]|uniref:hypothetical protein n=1 Tax=unclassified Crossiella TaxID=2620835 RepID=UPI001FFFDB1D|nr:MULTISPECIES: hypothetical protein [unclassified Crossiella]MCK2239554.1 hypothetical protein [Crossiella sp. S99.2]MCK2252249.1 hypothetical protein [Crossiella sp. S99.1]